MTKLVLQGLKGVGTALITPFKSDLSVDYAAFEKMVARQIDAGIHFLVVLGTTGETPCLEDDERIKLAALTAKLVQKKVPVIAGASSNCTQKTIANIRALEKTGVDGYLVVTPYYNKPTQEGLYQHFKAVAAATAKPIIMYNVPGRTGVNMSSDICLRLSMIDNIIATKEASGNFAQIEEIIRAAPKDFMIFSGNDDETLSLMASGAHGVISVASNVAPREMVELMNSLFANDLVLARQIQQRLLPLFKNCFLESNPIPVKAALAELKLIENFLRAPLYRANENTMRLMRQTLTELKLL